MLAIQHHHLIRHAVFFAVANAIITPNKAISYQHINKKA